MIKKILISIVIIASFTACQNKKLNYAATFPDSIVIVADELSKEMHGYKNYKIVFTSLVDLNDFKESSNFGRLFSESLMTQMAQRGYSVIEYRGNEIVSKNTKGEFKLNRARIQPIADENTLVLVGTYSKMDDSVIVNVRVVEKKNSTLVSAASAYLPIKTSKKAVIIKDTKKYKVQLVPSTCAENDYCWKEGND